MKSRPLNTVIPLLLATLLSACGGGGGGGKSATTPEMAAVANLNFTAIKNFQFTWTDVADATYYRLLENADGQSGFTQVSNDIGPGTQTFDHIVPLYARANAQYILQSCNAAGCTDASTLSVTDNLVSSIGYFKASNTGQGDLFGNAVSLSADSNTLVIGAQLEDSNTTGVNSIPNDGGAADGSGAVYVFSRLGTTWAQQAYIKASNAGAGDIFGKAVSLSADGNTLAVGALGEGSNTTGVNSAPNDTGLADDSGAAYVFSRTGTTWTEQAYIKASNTGAGDFFGIAVSLNADGNILAVGARFEDSSTTGVNSAPNDTGTADNSGAAYVFSRSGSTWTEQAYIKASNTGATDLFGDAVSLSADGNTLAVGALLEDSNTTGVNSTPNDDGAADNSGAAYLFSRTGTAWTEQAYIKASNTGANNSFGEAVSLSADGNTLAVGASDEDSNTIGVNSAPNDDTVEHGAVYMFSRSGTTLIEQAYLKASHAGEKDSFGNAVSLSADGNTLAVGSRTETSSTTGVNSVPSSMFGSDESGAAYLY